MKEIKDLLVITEGFPNPKNPYRYTFVEQLVQQFSQMDIRVTVINPVFHNHKEYQYLEHWSYEVANGNNITVFQPVVINFSMKKIGPLKMMDLSYRAFYHAVEQVTKNNHLQPDAIYAHFAFPSGCAAAELGRKTETSSFFATGESNLEEITNNLGADYLKKRLDGICGIISVSSENKRILTDYGIADDRHITVLPNSVDQSVFYPRDKEEMRKKYGFRNKSTIGVFVGAFSDRKGILRVNQASEMASIPMIYIGEGDLHPNGGNTVFSGGVKHDLIPEYLSAADFFVLPTKNEGCCNAIIEAICCGLPVISSNGRFNDDILEKDYSIRVDPEDIIQIADAMKKLSDDKKLCERLSKNALKQRDRFSLKRRAEAIMEYMGKQLI